jgi:ring-1,2-phenylacetyl-CoA epoxidase subunit PaaB
MTRSEAGSEPLWEVFIRPRRGLSHGHVGSLHAPDAEMALRNARDVYTRRQEGVSICRAASAITASSPDEKHASSIRCRQSTGTDATRCRRARRIYDRPRLRPSSATTR